MNATDTATTPVLVETPPRTCLTIAGSGSPEGAQFQDAMHAIYAVLYGLRFDLKRRGLPVFKAGPIEGLWWTDSGPAVPAVPDHPEGWHWKLLVAIPEVDEVALARVRAAAVKRGVTRAGDVRFETLVEGPCVQVLHIGPYETENEDLERMHALMIEAHLQPAGPHHEIYLSDPRRTRPEAIKTILRQPVR